ncbi:MAG: tRNA uridine-5-carboxymethylaminomethyl(34) synthesis GTPase MnmE [Bacteroidaceae bacterium]|nr:tRNA uridine-5-carboxymethylaminomethyl(34) synthesis GTPase MnmE [Bacteroidaceae bacterium]
MNTDSICALATPVGGAIAVIRLSGGRALDILAKIFRSRSFSTLQIENLPTRSLHYGHIVDATSSEEEIIDEVLVSVFRSPNSYTGEDSAEISSHGSRYITAKIIETLIRNGARQANPGEFTQRAFLNGKMDLSQAEAVADLIASANRATHRIAISQLRGHFSSELSLLREKLLRLTSLLELELDFSDHEDLEFADRSELLSLAKQIDERICTLASSFETGQALKNGIPVAIVGKTNVGKSTLLNRLLRDDRAIVSDIHGTTRDTIEDTIDIRDVTFRFIDTAGIRDTSDSVEQIGIQRTFAAIEKASIILWLTDQEPSSEEKTEMIKRCNGKSMIIARNKIDLNKSPIANSIQIDNKVFPIVNLSAKYDSNLNLLESAIYSAANIPTLTDSDIIVTSARHYEALLRAHTSISRVIDGLKQQLSGDLIAENLRFTLTHLADITGGAITPQETLSNIFSHFCVGK